MGRPTAPCCGLRPFQAAAPNRGSPEGAPKGAGRREGLLQPSTPPSLGGEGSKTLPPTGPGEILEDTPSSSRRSLASGPTLCVLQREGQSRERRGALGTAVLLLRALTDHRPFTLSDPPSPAAAGPAGWPGWTHACTDSGLSWWRVLARGQGLGTLAPLPRHTHPLATTPANSLPAAFLRSAQTCPFVPGSPVTQTESAVCFLGTGTLSGAGTARGEETSTETVPPTPGSHCPQGSGREPAHSPLLGGWPWRPRPEKSCCEVTARGGDRAEHFNSRKTRPG